LIHGQVIARWAKKWGTRRIIIADESLANDDFMKDIYVMAAPPDIRVDVCTPKQAVEMWTNGDIQKTATLLLFKNIPGVYEAVREGLAIADLQIGGLPGGPGRELVYKAISLDGTDRKLLDELSQSGVRVFFQMLPEEEPCLYEKKNA
jgi:D-glucosaminate-specific PTS system IIB component